VLNFIAIDLHLYKIFKIMQVSFFWGHSVVVYVIMYNVLYGGLAHHTVVDLLH